MRTDHSMYARHAADICVSRKCVGIRAGAELQGGNLGPPLVEDDAGVHCTLSGACELCAYVIVEVLNHRNLRSRKLLINNRTLAPGFTVIHVLPHKHCLDVFTSFHVLKCLLVVLNLRDYSSVELRCFGSLVETHWIKTDHVTYCHIAILIPFNHLR